MTWDVKREKLKSREEEDLQGKMGSGPEMAKACSSSSLLLLPWPQNSWLPLSLSETRKQYRDREKIQ